MSPSFFTGAKPTGSVVEAIEFLVLGEPASKANSRRLVKFGNRPAIIKAKKAIDYGENFRKQCPHLSELLEGPVRVEMTIWYASRRPDLDESVILDCMQGLIYVNDRQVKRKEVDWDIDPANPRALIRVSKMEDRWAKPTRRSRRVAA